MEQEIIEISESSSESPQLSKLVVSVRAMTSKSCQAVIGYPGLPNLRKEFEVGDAFLYQTPESGILEVRLVAITLLRARFQVSEVSPNNGFSAGFIDEDPYNLPFTAGELEHVATSLAEVKERLSISAALSEEQMDLVARKLDDIKSASERFGRKDWITWAGGTLTSLCISAAFAPEATKAIFAAMSAAFSWLLSGAAALLQ